LYWQAAQHFQAAVEENPEDSSSALRAAFLLLWLDDRAGYEKYCRLLLEQFSNSTDILHTRRTVQACLITPETIGDLALHERLAYSAAEASQNATVLRERALLAYRRGAWDAALSWARKSRDEAAEQAAAPADGSRTEPVNLTLCMAQYNVLESMAHHQLGQTIEARRAYEMAARLGQGSRPFATHYPGSTWVDWLTFEFNRQEAAKLLAIQDDSGWPLSPGHARTLAAAGDWKAAASELARACTSPAATSIEFVAAGTALARAEDREGYRRHCQTMIERFRGTDSWNDIERTVKVCALAPYDVEIPADMLAAVSQRMEEGTLEAWAVPWGNTARAQAAYRQNRFDDAAKWADAAANANETAGNRYARIQGFLIAAMAHHRRGDAAAAKDRLATALETRNRLALPKLPDGSFDERLLVLEYHSWWDVFAIDLMLREAKNLIEGAESDKLSASSQIANGSR
jgi:tetratricopeptide (TPR) repeat protein